MKSIFTMLLFCVWISCAFGQTVPTYFSSPGAGDVLVAGQNVTLKWLANSSSKAEGRISIWDQQTGVWSDLGTADYQSGSFQWKVPQLFGKAFRLRVTADNGDVIYSSGFFSVEPPAPKTGTRAPASAESMGLTVHPNPSGSYARLQVPALPAGTPLTMVVFNSAGQVVAMLNNATQDGDLGLTCILDCSKLPNGTYFARLLNDQLGQSAKFSVEH